MLVAANYSPLVHCNRPLLQPNTLSSPGNGPRNRAIKFFAIAMTMAFLAFWHARVTGILSWTALASFVLFVFLCLAYGHAFLVATADLVKNRAGLSFQFLCGFFVLNTLLFMLSLVSPFGMLTNVSILSLGALGLAALGVKPQPNVNDVHDELPSLLCILVSGLAATLWCSDSQTPLLIQGQTVIYQTWQDTFFHAREISTFAQANGIGTIHDIRMSEAPAQIYHFASYLSAAAISVLTGAPAIDVYSSFQLPLGIFLTGLAAFSLIASIWGGWPALAAAVAVVLVPDAYQQGFANRYLSYNFLAQVNLGMLYGIACAAIAWVFILEGCRRGKIHSILIGYVFLAVCLLYKAHIFVANAFLILIYPCLFFPGIRPRWRLIMGIGLVGVFVSVVGFSQTMARVPVMRLDGSGIGWYVVQLLGDFDAGLLKTFFTQVFKHEHHSKPVDGLYVVAMLLLSTFGLWIAATSVVIAAGRMKITAAILFFPLLIMTNYLVMSIGLALDTRGVGTPDELLNRPLVWAYFAVVAWTAGGGYYLAIGNGLPRSRVARTGLAALLCFSLAGPLVFSKNLQTFPVRQGKARYEEFNSVPLCLVRASQYIRDHSRSDEVIQDSENDRRFVVTALSERQLFAGESIFARPGKELQERLDGLAGFMRMRSADELMVYAASTNISWYLLRPSATVSWPVSFLQQTVFDCDGYRVYHFAK